MTVSNTDDLMPARRILDVDHLTDALVNNARMSAVERASADLITFGRRLAAPFKALSAQSKIANAGLSKALL